MYDGGGFNADDVVAFSKLWDTVKTFVFCILLYLGIVLEVMQGRDEAIKYKSGINTCTCIGFGIKIYASWRSPGGVSEKSCGVFEVSEACIRTSEGDKSMPVKAW